MADHQITENASISKSTSIIGTEERWQDGNGNWWTVGDITPDGLIVGFPVSGVGTFISCGVVWIRRDDLAKAQPHGWLTNGIEAGNLVQVTRK